MAVTTELHKEFILFKKPIMTDDINEPIKPETIGAVGFSDVRQQYLYSQMLLFIPYDKRENISYKN